MSAKIQIQTTIRDLKIAEDAIKKLGYSYTKEANGTLKVSHSYHAIVIDGTDKMTYDDMDKGRVVNIKKEYNRAMVIREVEANGEIYDVIEPTTANGDIRIVIH